MWLTTGNCLSVAAYFRNMLSSWADNKDPVERLALYEYVKVDQYYPIPDFAHFPLQTNTGPNPHTLTA